MKKGLLHGGLTLAAVGVIVFLIMSGGGEDVIAPPARTPTTIDPDKAGIIRGAVSFKGAPPANRRLMLPPECRVFHQGTPLNRVHLIKDGRVQNVFVFIRSGLEKIIFPYEEGTHRIDNARCLYTPRVSGARFWQPVEFGNDDPVLHNVKIEDPQGWTIVNRSIPNRGRSFKFQFRPGEHRPGLYKLRCDIHTWMVGYLHVLDHPHFQTTGEDGSFEFKNLPAGTYEVEAWHEQFGTRTLKLEVRAKETSAAAFEFGE